MPRYFERAINRYGEWRYPEHRPQVRQTRINGFEILVLANEEVGRRILLHRSYEARDAELFKRVVRPDDICAEIGANTGYYAFLMASLATRGQVHAFEPSPLSFHLLGAGACLNGFSRLVANQAAVCADSGVRSFSVATDGAYASLRPTGRKPEAQSVQVEAVRLDTYLDACKLPGFDVMKIDVEGAELEVLRGASSLLSGPHRPRVVMIELCTRNLVQYGTSIPEIVDAMQTCGYLAFVAEREGVRPFSGRDYDRIFNVFFALAATDLP